MAARRVEIQRILCPTDFSEFSSRALAHAVALARQFEASLNLLHVVPSPASFQGGSGYLPALDAIRRQAAVQLRECARLAGRSLATVQTDLREGEPWRVIQEMAQALPADLVVMGTHGRAGFEHLLLGSVAEKVLRRAPCPVLTVGRAGQGPQPDGRYPHILCATDLSESSAATVAFALSLAEEGQSELTLLHVLEGLHLYRDAPELDPLRRQLEDVARGQLAASVPTEARAWCSVHELVVPGRAHEQVLRAAAETRADLIVMGAGRHGPLGRLLFGSSSQSVVRAAPCPLLTVPPAREPAPIAERAWLTGAQAPPSLA